MKKRFRDAVEDTSYEDLLKIKKDLESGGHHLKRLIGDKINAIESEEIKLCATCGTAINPHFMDDFSLIFGRYDFKKRAYFCGLDCLNYFLSTLTQKEKDKLTKERIPAGQN